MKKYIKPKSLTFWAGMIPLASGIVLAVSRSVPALQPIGAVLDAVYDGATPGTLINAGIGAIGLRAALGK